MGNANEAFAKWASSYTGMDGGNPEGPIWFCGIEYGGASTEKDFADLSNEIAHYNSNKIPYVDHNQRKAKDFNCQFNHKIAKIACAYLNNKHYWKDYLLNNLCDKNSDVLKMNLYPVNFKDTNLINWSDRHIAITGMYQKVQYKAWCIQNRFPQLNNLLIKYSPKVLIGVGSDHKLDYLLAFTDLLQAKFEEHILNSTKTKLCECAWINGGKTLMILTPFLGQGGLMSDETLQSLGRLARELSPPK